MHKIKALYEKIRKFIKTIMDRPAQNLASKAYSSVEMLGAASPLSKEFQLYSAIKWQGSPEAILTYYELSKHGMSLDQIMVEFAAEYPASAWLLS